MHIHYKVKMQQNSFKDLAFRSHYVYCEGESDNLTICEDNGLFCCEHHSKLDEISQMNSINKIVKKLDLSDWNTRQIPVDPLTRHCRNTANDEQLQQSYREAITTLILAATSLQKAGILTKTLPTPHDAWYIIKLEIDSI